MELFDEDLLRFHLPKVFKSLTKEYIIECIFNEKIQKKWIPQEGDIIVGPSGNIFTIGTISRRAPEIGGDICLFNPTLCNRDGGAFLNSTYALTFNEDGLWYDFDADAKAFVGKKNYNHGAKSDFRFVPYPHELQYYIYE